LTDKNSWRFCSGDQNPADLPSRSCKGQNLVDNMLWWNGPGFLTKGSDKWSDMPPKLDASVAEVERIHNPPVIVHSLVNVQSQQNHLNLEAILDLSRYGSMPKLIRVTGLMLKFIDLLKRKGLRDTNILEAKDLRRAEDLWVKSIQVKSFPEEYNKLAAGESIVYRSHWYSF